MNWSLKGMAKGDRLDRPGFNPGDYTPAQMPNTFTNQDVESMPKVVPPTYGNVKEKNRQANLPKLSGSDAIKQAVAVHEFKQQQQRRMEIDTAPIYRYTTKPLGDFTQNVFFKAPPNKGPKSK